MLKLPANNHIVMEWQIICMTRTLTTDTILYRHTHSNYWCHNSIDYLNIFEEKGMGTCLRQYLFCSLTGEQH